jgi:hypothetical protein
MPPAPGADKKVGATMDPNARTVNYGLAGGYLDAAKHLDRARRMVLPEPTPSDIERMLQEAEAWANGTPEA